MSLHDPLIAFRQMRDHAQEAMALLAGKSRSELESDRVLSLAVVRLLEILGEATRRVPTEIQQAHPAIPWSYIVGMRNRLIHGYDRVDLDIVWSVVVADRPPLVARLEALTAGR